jgi:hypothetical protein
MLNSRGMSRVRVTAALVVLLALCGSARASTRAAKHGILEAALGGREEKVTRSSAVVAASLDVSPELVSVWSLVLRLTEEQARNPKPYTLNPKPYTLNPKP